MIEQEMYWELVSRMSQVGLIIVRAYFLCRLMKPFVQCGNTGESGLFRRALPGIGYALVMVPAALCDDEVSVIFVYTVSVLTAFVILYLTDKRNAAQKIFLSVVFYLLQWIIWGITLVPWRVLYDLLLLLTGSPKSYPVLFALYVVMEICDIVMHSLVMAFCVRMIHREYSHKTENMTKGELVLMLAPLFSVAAGQGMFFFAENAYEKDTGQYMWENYSMYSILLAVFMAVSFAVVMTVIVSYQRIKGNRRKEKEEAVLSRQVEEMKRHIGEVEKLYVDIRSLKHDMKNHILTLEKLCGENREAGEYLAQLKEQVSAAAPVCVSGNPVTDVILREKQKEAEERNIAFTHRFYFPEGTKLNVFDVSVILNNALDNALEAAKECEHPYIFISAYREKNAFMIEMRNSMKGKRKIDAESGLPVTTKAGAEHGFGLANIRKVAQKYYGDIVIEQEEGEFRAVVMMMV